jgi:hypothetical protein
MSKGFNCAEEGHIVPLVYPVDITGGVTGSVFNMGKYAHASIIVLAGVSAAAWTKVIVNACTDAAGSNPTAQAFTIYKGETTNVDTLGAATAVTSAGYTPSATDKIFYVIEIDASALPDGYNFVQLSLTNGSNSVIGAALAVLSGARYANTQSPTALA